MVLSKEYHGIAEESFSEESIAENSSDSNADSHYEENCFSNSLVPADFGGIPEAIDDTTYPENPITYLTPPSSFASCVGFSPSNSRLECIDQKILHIIIMELDVDSLMFFRCTNSYFCKAVSSVYAYRQMMLRAFSSIKTLRVAGVSSYFPLKQLYAEFLEPRCRFCGTLCFRIHLLTCQRACSTCLESRPELQVHEIGVIDGGYPLRRNVLTKNLRTMFAWGDTWTSRLELIGIQAAEKLLTRLFYTENSNAQWREVVESGTESLTSIWVEGGEEEDHVQYVKFIGPLSPKWRAMSSTPFPSKEEEEEEEEDDDDDEEKDHNDMQDTNSTTALGAN
ncbi:hypothetical protein LOY86_005631 [Ophidiomyces ophidiicola]|nr:hypothetical protein LOY86_005631 [Ophidiomyces ophidiicola]